VRIAQVAPLAESVPPKLYGGTERVVSWLTNELVELGHDVTLFASGSSITKARLVEAWPRALRLSRPRPDPTLPLASLLSLLAERASEFDIIHAHIDWLHLPLLRHLGVPHLTTLHGRLDLPELAVGARHFGSSPFVSISNSQREPLPGLNWLGTVYHGLPTDSLTPRFEAGTYLAFLGRITPDKGPEIAIRLAKAAGMPLRLAAKLPRAQDRFFKEQIQPLLDGTDAKFIGEVNDARKADLLAGAAALLFPIKWPEPFGLVMIEAMACGTPVIAFRSGSVPEVVEHGQTGFVVNDEAEALAAITRLNELDRRQVRRRFEERFSSRRMAEDYQCHYKSLTQGRADRELVVEPGPDLELANAIARPAKPSLAIDQLRQEAIDETDFP
jgi:glycosyltransferase involved in cell wall biosynthesis